ncbi:MAG: hypothetical protein ABIR27_06250 [Dokdonella sp.]
MSTNQNQNLPSTQRLLKATGLSMVVAALLLVAVVMPAEYGIDPTGIGDRLGLGVLGANSTAATPAEPTEPASVTLVSADTDAANAALAAKAEAAFGKSDGQSLDAGAVSLATGPFRRSALTVILEPGKGAEVKAQLKAGDGLVFHWTASADVAVDMHGERLNVKNAWTSYAVEAAQRESSGTFVAPFEGSHGWYWKNHGTEPVTVEVEVVGFQPDLHRP